MVRGAVFWIAGAMVFGAFGIFMLVTAYHQNNPIVFLALFFSSSLIILLSAALIVGLIWRFLSPEEKPTDEKPD